MQIKILCNHCESREQQKFKYSDFNIGIIMTRIKVQHR